MNKQIFLSSTFTDFNLERDLINSVVKSKVNDALGLLSCSFIDLRWGVDTSYETPKTKMKKILSRCTEVVRSTKPYFILLLGDNYGTLIDEEDYNLFCKFNRINQGDGLTSLTELETIISGFYDERVDGGLYLVLKRNILNKDGLKESKYIGQKNIDKLDNFRERVKKSKAIEIAYNAFVDEDDNLSLCNEEKFVDDVSNAIVNALKKEIDTGARDDALAKQKHFFDNLEQSFLKETIIREKLLSDIKAATFSNKITYISGESGTGKTCLMIWAKNMLLDLASCGCYSFYAGDTFLSLTDETIIDYFTHVSGRRRNLYSNYYSLFNSFDDEKEVYFFVDASNEIQKTKLMSLDETFIPDNVHLIVSTCDSVDNSIVVGDFEDEEVVLAIKRACDSAHKEIDTEYFEYVRKNDPKTFNKLKKPLILSLFISSIISFEKEDFDFIEKLGKKNGFQYDASLLCLLDYKLHEISSDVHEELLKRIGSRKSLLILVFVALSFSGLSLNMIKLFYKNLFKEELSDLAFFNLQSQLSGFLRKDKDGCYSISHSSLKQLVLNEIGKFKSIVIRSMQEVLSKEKLNDYEKISEMIHLYYVDGNYRALAGIAANLAINDKRENVYGPLLLDENSTSQSLVNIHIYIYKQTLGSYKFDLFEKFIEMNNPYAVLFCYRYMLLGLSGIEQHNYMDLFVKALTQCLTIDDASPAMEYDILGMLELAVNDLLSYGRVEDALKLLNAHSSYAPKISYVLLCELGVSSFETIMSEREQLIDLFKQLAQERYDWVKKGDSLSAREYYNVQPIIPFIAASPFVYNHFFSKSEVTDLISFLTDYYEQPESATYGLNVLLYYTILTLIIIEFIEIDDPHPYYKRCLKVVEDNIKKCDFSLVNNYDNALVFDFLANHVMDKKQDYKRLCTSINKIFNDIPVMLLSTCAHVVIWNIFDEDRDSIILLKAINNKFYSAFFNKHISTNAAQVFFTSTVMVYLNSLNSDEDKTQFKKDVECIFECSPIDIEMATRISQQLPLDEEKCALNQESLEDKKAFINDCLNKYRN